MAFKIPLVRNTITSKDLQALAKWLMKSPHITKGPLSEKFEQKFAKWQGTKYAHYVNSGSSANFLAINSLLISGHLKPSDSVIAPAVSWTTTVAPITQLGCKPILCDCNLDDLGVDIKHLEALVKKPRVKAVIICHILGIPNQIDKIIKICKKNQLFLIEDCCEALGSEYNSKKVGNFGAMSTFSFYFGHHMSTIEGGMICTNSALLSNIIRSIRSHGWNRDLDENVKLKLRRQYKVDPFADQYTFYHPGYNFRGTDLGAFLGLRQLRKLNRTINQRTHLWNYYLTHTIKSAWQPKPPPKAAVSGFAFPLLSRYRSKLAAHLNSHGIETRPLVCGSLGRQPWFIDRYGTTPLKNADIIHQQGLYVPINPELKSSEIKFIAKICTEFL